MNSPGQPPQRSVVRPEIQALRAVAVMLVVGYHLWPGRFPGGFVGVDVFFVISGLLITSHLVREVRAEGRIDLGRFWARRARRLLPAAYLVLAVSAVVTWLVMPMATWQQNFREILASSIYVQNWRLAADSVDYLAEGSSASLVQHYWTLSVEEQFYLVWPLLILLAAFVAHRTGRRPLRAVAVLLAVVTLASFAYSLWVTTNNPAAAYFVTPARAWEFGAGALLGLAQSSTVVSRRFARVPDGVRSLVSWAGIVAMVWCAFGFSGGTAFPGTAALLPVAGSLAVLAAGAPGGLLSPIPLARLRPVQTLGDQSYGIYLWHWPPIIFLPVLIGPLGAVERPLVLVGTLVVAALSKRFVEDPLRTGRVLGLHRRSVTFGLTGVTAAVLVAACGLGTAAANQARDHQQELAQQLASGSVRCAGAASMDPSAPCDNPDLADQIVPAPGQHTDQGRLDCFPGLTDGTLRTCDFGAVDDPAVPHLVVIGDSHARSLLPALDELVGEGKVSVTTVLKTACAWSTHPLGDPDPIRNEACDEWRGQLTTWLTDHVTPRDVVITAAYAPYLRGPEQERVDGLVEAWDEVASRGVKVIGVRDNPRNKVDTNICLDRPQQTVASCSSPRAVGLKDFDAITPAVAAVPGAGLLDLTDLYCTDTVCPAVIGGVNVYLDDHHISPTYARTMSAIVERRLRGLGALPAA